MKAVYAKTREELSIKTLGLYHDRCYHYYNGKMDSLPSKYNEFKDESYDYILIYSEQIKP